MVAGMLFFSVLYLSRFFLLSLSFLSASYALLRYASHKRAIVCLRLIRSPFEPSIQAAEKGAVLVYGSDGHTDSLKLRKQKAALAGLLTHDGERAMRQKQACNFSFLGLRKCYILQRAPTPRRGAPPGSPPGDPNHRYLEFRI